MAAGRNTYKGKFRPKHPEKYVGNIDNITYRSLWERQVLRWLDDNVSVLSYSSEEVIIPYVCKTDNKVHRYFVDFKIKLKSGHTYLIEVKPEKETREPVKGKNKKTYHNAVMTYIKNQSKWEQANKYCKDRGWVFEIWTEKTLEALGIKLLGTKKKAFKKFPPIKRINRK